MPRAVAVVRPSAWLAASLSVLATALLPRVALAQAPSEADAPASSASFWTHAVVLHPPDLNVFYPISPDGRQNNPRSVTLAYRATYVDGLALQVFAGVADGPEVLRPLAGRYRGLDLGAGILYGGPRGRGEAYWRGLGARVAFAQVGFDFDGYALAPGGGYFVAVGSGRGALRQWSVEPQWVHRWYVPGTPLLFEVSLGVEVGGRGMFSRLELFPNFVDEVPVLLEPNQYHPFLGVRLRFGVGWEH